MVGGKGKYRKMTMGWKRGWGIKIYAKENPLNGGSAPPARIGPVSYKCAVT